jgi:hypothetical protein
MPPHRSTSITEASTLRSVAPELTLGIGILPHGLHRLSFPSIAKGQGSRVPQNSLQVELVPPLHRLPLGRFADHSPSSSRGQLSPTVLTAPLMFRCVISGSSHSPSQLTPASFNADFSAVAHDQGLLNPSRTAWFDASLCLPTSRGLPSSTSVASKNRSFDPSFASHITVIIRGFKLRNTSLWVT